MAALDPMANTYPVLPPTVSKKTFTIAGILTTVHGLDELNRSIKNVACLWLLHPRLQTQECMEPLAASNIHEWNRRLQRRKKDEVLIGLIAVSFDQRNHGSREINKLANETWKSGDERHAQDMFSIFHGTTVDVSLLITYLSSYIFPMSEHIITDNMVCGVSLGGHSAWQCILHDARISTAIIIIGCPDYTSLMSDRARLSKLDTWTSGIPPGSRFLGSKDFPQGLVHAVGKYDPVGLFMGQFSTRTDENYTHPLSDREKRRLILTMNNLLRGKRILNLAGGADKLVPYKLTVPFIRWLQDAVAPGGLSGDGGTVVEDIVFDGVGHEMSPGMVKEVVRFVVESLDKNLTLTKSSLRQSKI
ncbi:hypothetical protein MMC22_006071 [Lobaria immixta]|nr:hypothetical protein [Lobaria immixta]